VSYRLALDESARADDVVIEAAGVRFLADRDELPMISNLRIEVDDRRGQPRLLLAHPAWMPHGMFQERVE
jgi:Fe-S cluster assembly iron-binding protein IscA